MKSFSAIFILTIIFLSAGAVANNPKIPAQLDKPEYSNVTVVSKNQSWPLLSLMTVESCSQVRCIDV